MMHVVEKPVHLQFPVKKRVFRYQFLEKNRDGVRSHGAKGLSYPVNRFLVPIGDPERAEFNAAARAGGFLEPLVNRFACVRRRTFSEEQRRGACEDDNYQAKEDDLAFHRRQLCQMTVKRSTFSY